MPDYQIFCITKPCLCVLTYFLTGSFLLLLCTTNHRIPLGYTLQLLVHGHKGTQPFYVFWISSVPTWYSERPSGDCGSRVFTAEEVDGVGAKESGNDTLVNVETLFDAFLEDFQTWKSFLNC